MLEDLTVKDFALIESVSLDFGNGFTVLSGETGAGKSILIGSLTFLLGGKAGPESIRSGADEARVSGTVYLSPENRMARAWLSDKGIEPDADRVLLRRILRTNGKSGTWIQDTPITRAELAEFTSFIVDIHGQHDHQSLMKVEEHRRFLDAYAGIEDEVAQFTALYAALAARRKLRDDMNASDQNRQQKIELLEFAVDEITKANLALDEEDALTAEEQRLAQYEKLYGYAEQTTEAMCGGEGVILALKRLRGALEAAAAIDAELTPTLTRFENSYYELEDVGETIRRYRDQLSFNPERLGEIEERLSLIYRLKKKYGGSIAEILAYAKDAAAQLEQLGSWDTSRAKLDAEIADLEKGLFTAGTAISAKRRASAERMQSAVESILRALGMNGTVFTVSLTVRDGTDTVQRSGPYGFDIVEFMISPNLGEPLRPLAKIASGGELSRVMLALKTVLADADESGTLIFDEIDTGIGGEVALAVGAHLGELSSRKQILCITHLASIAVRADTQIKIEKAAESGKTVTRAFAVEGKRRIEEIARMLSGDGFSAASLQHAEELLARYASKKSDNLPANAG